MTTTRPNPDPDAVYRAYFQAERPQPWPWPEAPADLTPVTVAAPRRGWSLADARSRLTLAASVLVVLGGGLVLAPRLAAPAGGTPSTGAGMLDKGTADAKKTIDAVVPPKPRR